MAARSSLFACAWWALIMSQPVLCAAIDATNVMVVYNASSSDGAQIAAAYAQVHPGVRLVGLSNVPTGDEITADQYLSIIRPQVLSALGSAAAAGTTIDDIVTTKGLPVRINVTEQFTGTNPTYVDSQGVSHTVYTVAHYSSLESELTQVGNLSTWKQMEDQTWWDPRITSQSKNLYYNNGGSFDHNNPALGGMYLTSRLDGYNAADVIASLNRAQHVVYGPYNFVVDNDPTKVYNAGMQSLVNNVLLPAHQSTTFDNTPGFVGTAPGPVLGYVSNGANQAATPANFMLNTTTGLQFSLAPGAVAETWESYNACTYNQGGNWGNQSLIADWIHRGGTAAVGNVQEPGASLSNVTNEDIMFNMLLHGYTWGEAAWAATQQLSYVNTVVGDPLMVWHPALPGDLNGDGTVGAADLAILTQNFGASGAGGGAMWGLGDLDGNGKVGASDMAIFAANWGKTLTSTGGQGYGGIAGAGDGSDWASVPEPSSGLLAAIGALASLAAYRFKYRQKQSRSILPAVGHQARVSA